MGLADHLPWVHPIVRVERPLDGDREHEARVLQRLVQMQARDVGFDRRVEIVHADAHDLAHLTHDCRASDGLVHSLVPSRSKDERLGSWFDKLTTSGMSGYIARTRLLVIAERTLFPHVPAIGDRYEHVTGRHLAAVHVKRDRRLVERVGEDVILEWRDEAAGGPDGRVHAALFLEPVR